MNGSRILLAVLVSLMVAAAGTSSAQFGSLMKKKDSGGGIGASQGDVEAQQSQLVKRFVGAQEDLIDAQSLIADALGLKEEKEKLDTEAKALGTGNVDKSSLQKSVTLTENANKAIQKKIDEGATLSDKGKVLLGKSLVPYAKSVTGTGGMVADAKILADGIQGQIKAAGMTGAMKIKKAFDVGLYLAPKIPTFAGGQLSQLKKMIDFARKAGVKIPKDVNDAI
jgi:hypothetical protein